MANRNCANFSAEGQESDTTAHEGAALLSTLKTV